MLRSTHAINTTKFAADMEKVRRSTFSLKKVLGYRDAGTE
jgi:hypothetical protein